MKDSTANLYATHLLLYQKDKACFRRLYLLQIVTWKS